ncbi:MAG: DUF2141 domain-containing protein [Candidatus Obscuribacterales bacterium]|nr:DUF2141 domain-containing protein [Candidatus Obscuribacterales bacterium]
MPYLRKLLTPITTKLILGFLGCGIWQPGWSADLNVHITGFKNDEGVVQVQLFNSEKAFVSKDPTGAYRKDKVKINGDELFVTFKDLPNGEYALRYFHDEKNTGKPPGPGLGGFPEMGFSNNAKLAFGMAKVYKEAKFELKEDQSIELKVGAGPKFPFFGKKKKDM